MTHDLDTGHSGASLEACIAARSARIAVVGLGSVGLPLSATFCAAGFEVLGFDVDAAKLAQLADHERTVRYLGDHVWRELFESERFDATADFERLSECDVALLAVPTPLASDRTPDLSFVRAAASSVARYLRPGRLCVLESTTYPGTTRDVLGTIFREAKLEPGRDVFLAYSPEREDPGRTDRTTATIPKLVGGTCERSGALAKALYGAAFEEVHPVARAEIAEAAKITENVFRAVNIALVNELKLVLGAQDVDVWEVIDAAATKPFGFMKFTPGPGMGGHCIPVDPFYLAWLARQAGRPARLIEAAGEINTEMPKSVVAVTERALLGTGKTLAGARVLVLGLAYKRDVDILCESPALALVRLFHEAGAAVGASDPLIADPKSLAPELGEARIEPFDAATLSSYDVVVLATDHSLFDGELIAREARLVIDTRNALAPFMSGRDNYFKA